MAATGKLIVEIQADGTLKTNARELIGEETEILEALQELASDLGGTLTVEKHIPGAHHHHHGRGHVHSHGGGGHKH